MVELNLVAVTKTVVDAVKECFAPAGAAWKVIPRIGKSFLIAIAVYVAIMVLSLIPGLVAPLIGISFLWAVAYAFLAKKDKS